MTTDALTANLDEATGPRCSAQGMSITENLDSPCYSVRDFLVLAAAARAARKPLDQVVDALLDMVGEA